MLRPGRTLVISAILAVVAAWPESSLTAGAPRSPRSVSAPTNVAAAANGGTTSASSTHSAGYPGGGAINGDRSGANWGSGGGWNDATPDAFPDWLQVDFGAPAAIDEIDVFSVQDAYQSPGAPTLSMTFSLYGLAGFEAQYWDGASWQAIPGGSIASNNLVWRQITFSPITTSRIRILVTQGLGSWSRLAEVEAWGTPAGPPPPPPPPRANVALAAAGATAVASTTYSPGYAPAGAINGDRTGSGWATGGGWNDATAGAFPDWLEIDFSGDKTIDEIDVFSVQDAYQAPGNPTLATTFTLYGLRDFEVQYWTGAAWQAVPSGAITGNTHVWRQVTFPALTTSRIRIHVTQAADQWSRVAEVEAWGGAGGGPPPDPPAAGGVNVALAANGASWLASSTHSPGFAGSGAINGDRTGASWGNGGGWNDATPDTFPDWLEVDFSGEKTIDEIDIFSVQDAYSSPSTPTLATTFSLYGLRDFEVQYWTGAQWAVVPGGAVSGNNRVWRQFLFAPVTTSRIRVLVTNALSTYSRVAEIEAYTVELAPPPIQPSGLTVRVDLVGHAPTHVNLTSPARAGTQLLIVDQADLSISRWDGAQFHSLVTSATLPPGISPIGPEGILNVAANASGARVYVMFTSSTVPAGIPQRLSPRPGADAWQVLYRYDFNGVALSNPQPVTALQVRHDGHSGGGLVVLDDDSVLVSTGDNGDAGEDGREYTQDATNHLGKILRITPVNGSAAVVAVGIRNTQRLVINPNAGDPRLDFADIGGWVAEELNSIRVVDLLSSPTAVNFGWGRSAVDQRAREGTFYIDAAGSAVGNAPMPEAGFLQPVAQFGRAGAEFIAITGPVASTVSFGQITSLFGDLPSGNVYAVLGSLAQPGQSTYSVSLVTGGGQATTFAALAGGRPDPRFFLFPDGTAGVLLERTGDFYRLTQVPPAPAHAVQAASRK